MANLDTYRCWNKDLEESVTRLNSKRSSGRRREVDIQGGQKIGAVVC